jgi:nucleotide-binding universal stress UspA family protein
MTRLIEVPSPPDPRPAVTPPVAFRRILWACNFSPSSIAALRFVAPLARAYGSELTAVHVMPDRLPDGGAPAPAANPALQHARLHHDVTMALDGEVGRVIEGAVPSHIALREGKAADEILHLAADLPADLVAMGTSRSPAARGREEASIADAILGRARCPVLVLPADASPLPALVAGTVLCATDFSPQSALALRYAVSLASRFRVPLLLVHVIAGDAAEANDRLTGAATERLREAFVAEHPGCAGESVVTTGDAASGVLRIARERGAGLIVMGVRGALTLHTAFFGSIAQRVAHDAPCAVLAVRSPE